jgi:tetratricopeptide (TPR) repeat protein
MVHYKSVLFRKIVWFLFIALMGTSCSPKKVTLVFDPDGPGSLRFGTTRIADVLKESGYTIAFSDSIITDLEGTLIVIAQSGHPLADWFSRVEINRQKEGFTLHSNGKSIAVLGADPTGTLYGCLELAERMKARGRIPGNVSFSDQPEMVLRGTCIGLQKTAYLPGRSVYEYPYTPENFPWFYDKERWIDYLDMLVENRYNALFLWNGHPFASLVRLEDYPYAVEVDDETFAKNEEVFGFLTEEATKRGIWVIQMFYNIIVSKPFAEHHGIATQDRSRPIDPLIADYTRQSIAAFIEKYPNVGLMPCLGEAINTIDDDVEWFTQTIIPGVKEGLKKRGITEEPPLVLRGHDTDPEKVMNAALPVYKNLYTVAKYNGESLTTYEPRDSWATIHQGLSRLGSVHISNVHILANLEPFRYGAPGFIQKCVQAMHDIQGANGLHLYPQASYWDWPYSADKVPGRLKQIERDWIWYKAWGRYAWNCRRDSTTEQDFWSEQLGKYYGTPEKSSFILEAYEQTGEMAPKLLRRFGISDGNRQTLLLGMFMSQLVNPYKWHVYSNFYASNGPEGEILIDYARKEWKGEMHQGELPTQIIAETVQHGKMAVEAIEKAAPFVTKNKEEFERLKNDVYCYDAFARFFHEKVKAALEVLRYKYSNDIADLERALPYLEKSLECFKELVDLTKDTYLYANSMQTQQRRIPITGRNGTNKTWAEMLPHYQQEMDNFKRNIAMLKKAEGFSGEKVYKVLEPVPVDILSPEISSYPVQKGAKIYADQDYVIEEFAPELRKLKGLQFSDATQQEKGTTLRFRNNQAVKILVGYFNTNSYTVLRPPTLETNANANDRGQADIKIANAVKLNDLYPVNIYTYHYKAGENELNLGIGRVLILGFIDGRENIPVHDAGLTDKTDGIPVDWLFY